MNGSNGLSANPDQVSFNLCSLAIETLDSYKGHYIVLLIIAIIITIVILDSNRLHHECTYQCVVEWMQLVEMLILHHSFSTLLGDLRVSMCWNTTPIVCRIHFFIEGLVISTMLQFTQLRPKIAQSQCKNVLFTESCVSFWFWQFNILVFLFISLSCNFCFFPIFCVKLIT